MHYIDLRFSAVTLYILKKPVKRVIDYLRSLDLYTMLR